MPGKTEAQPIDRIFAILDAVIAAEKTVSLAEIAATSGMPAPTVHRLIGNLEGRRLLKRALGSSKWLLPPRLVQMGRDTLENGLIADEPHEILEQLAS
jgi:IclR family acetate operon transcriptional repressor